MDIADRAQEVERLHLLQAMAQLDRSTSQRPSATTCIDCDDPIPEGRRQALPGVQKCAFCAD